MSVNPARLPTKLRPFSNILAGELGQFPETTDQTKRAGSLQTGRIIGKLKSSTYSCIFQNIGRSCRSIPRDSRQNYVHFPTYWPVNSVNSPRQPTKLNGLALSKLAELLANSKAQLIRVFSKILGGHVGQSRETPDKITSIFQHIGR